MNHDSTPPGIDPDRTREEAQRFADGPGAGALETRITFKADARYATEVWEIEVPLRGGAILDADLGLSVVTDEKGLRVVFPQLTGERREELLKIAKGQLEDARVSVRGARDEQVKTMEKAIQSDDEKFAAKEDMQKRVDAANKEFNDLFAQKELEIKQ